MTRHIPSLLALTLFACGDKDGGGGDDGSVDSGDPVVDADGDGSPEGEDCDDADATRAPGLTEVCDGVDNDCDDLVDDEDSDWDASTGGVWYPDSDADGFGDGTTPLAACEPPSGAVEDDQDCDDADDAIHPDATEVCDDVDNDCDTLVDDADDSLDTTTASSWYADADADGYGGGDPTLLCLAPSGSVTDDTDCDDEDDTVLPGGTELCDGQDNDCDGALPDDEADVDGDGWVECAEDAGGWDGEAISGGEDCDDEDAGIHPTAAERCDGVDDDCDGALDTTESDADGDGWVACTPEDWAGTSISGGDDCDDTDATIHPGATEICDGSVDEDCDGLVDDADSSVDPTSQTAWFLDADSDGYGDADGSPTLACVQPSGSVVDNTDCDDSDDTISPAEAERCDGLDTDCDGDSTDESGIATFTDSAGIDSDLTATLAVGTSGSPAGLTLADAGDLAVCDGTWFVALEVEASVDVWNPSGDAADVMLDGGGSEPVLSIDADGIAVSLTDLTVQNGSSSGSGGNIACEATGTSIDLDGVDVLDGEALTGGGIAVEGCTLGLDDTLVSGNQAESVGGILLIDASGVITDSELSGNEATDSDAGGLGVLASSATISLSMSGSVIEDNTAAGTGGGLMALEDGGSLSVSCTGTTSTTEGIIGNTGDDDAGGMALVGEVDFTATDCDFGASGTADDNAPYDLTTAADGQVFNLGDDESFTCTAGVCATLSGSASGTHLIGGPASTATQNNSGRGNIFEATADGTIDGFELYLTATGTCSVDLYVLSNSSVTTTGWTVEWSSLGNSVSSAGYVDTGSIGVSTTTGTHYALVSGWQCGSGTATYRYNTDSADDTISGFAEHSGAGGWNLTYTSTLAGSGQSLGWASASDIARYDMIIDYTY
jgi:hypothetical protein